MTTTTLTTEAGKRLTALVAPYAKPSNARSIFQLLNSAIPFGLSWVLMLLTLGVVPYWVTLLLAVPATGFLVRLFIIQHDCGHGSFFRSRVVNNTIGSSIGLLTLTPYAYWSKTHAIHHATSGNIDLQTFGDVTTLTVRQYVGLSRWRRLLYRIYRSPIVLFGVGPIYQFMFKHRLPLDLPRSMKREWKSIIRNNIALLVAILIMWQTIGLRAFLMVQLPITVLAGIVGVWLFYIQHQFEDTYWANEGEWAYHDAGMHGSSYYQLPRILNWFTGNIGVHHIHHLSSRIPNYRLQKAFREIPEFQCVTQLTLWASLKCARLKLWDEERRKLIGFRQLRLATAKS